MTSSNLIKLIAPCGMNCGICMSYLRTKNHCSGCRGDDKGKPVSCVRCIIKNCEAFQDGKAKYCFECGGYPCTRLKQLDKRYRTRYSMSMIENLENIRDNGINKFLAGEKERWACPVCGGTICVHYKKCSVCGA